MQCRTEYKNRTISVNLNITGCDTLTIQNVNITDSTVMIHANEAVNISDFHAEAGSEVSITVGNSDFDPPSILPEHDEIKINDETAFAEHLFTHTEMQSSCSFTLNPNPNAGTFQLETNFPLSNIRDVKVINLLGVSVYETQNLTSGNIQLPSSATGQHFVVITFKDGSVLTQKMMIRR
jgi:hypothetical protein